MPAQAEQVLFSEEQTFRQTWVWALVSGMAVVLAVAFYLVLSKPIHQGQMAPAVLGLGFGVVMEVATAIFLYVLKLTVWLDNEHLHVRFYPLVKRDIPLTDIVHWEARTYRPIMEFGGWGVRYGLKGMAYNVSGNRGVQLVFHTGKRLLIGSQQADELAAAISQAKEHTSG